MHHEIVLNGCAPTPLIHYLKALGIFRLVAEQLDAHVRGAWYGDAFALHTAQTPEDLVAFFLHAYSPTPIIAPWNGSSGFYPKDRKPRAMLDALCRTATPRLHAYHDTIAAARAMVGDRQKQPEQEEKEAMLRHARQVFSDHAVQWLDAAYVLSEKKPEYPPLFGSGGNDGRLDFTTNFVARLLSVLPEALKQKAEAQWAQQQSQGKLTEDRRLRLKERLTRQLGEQIAQSEQQLRAALFRDRVATLDAVSVGQFYPAGTGGANATEGVRGDSLVNPWDFVLVIEGALLLASASVRQLTAGSRSRASFPFTTANSTVGYGTASDNERMRAEMWLPLWSRPAGFAEVAHIFGEGRAQFSRTRRHAVRSGFDFARAVAELGVDRGIDAFERYAFLERNGQSNLAAPLGRFAVQERPRAARLYDFDPWLDALRRAARNSKAPPRFARALSRIEEASFQLCASGQAADLLATLLALGAAEAELAQSPRFRDEHTLWPLFGLHPRWVAECDDQSVEFELAAALASISGEQTSADLRIHLEPVEVKGTRVTWTSQDTSTVWSAGTLPDNLAAVLQRRAIDARMAGASHPALSSRRHASLAAIAAFLQGKTDDARLEALLRGLVLINWRSLSARSLPFASFVPPTLPRAYAVLKLLFLPDGKFRRDPGDDPISIRHEPAIVPLLRAGRIPEALEIADRRLRSSGLTPLTRCFHMAPEANKRLAAALLMPVAEPAVGALADLVLRPVEPDA
ncbi:hypothetical protein NKDENANG_01442 [Candidatus Entotheonellaceae bacterium PAL068K]